MINLARRLAAPVAATALCAAVAAGPAAAPTPAVADEFPGTSVTLLSRNVAGLPATGTSAAPAISHDRRWARVVAFQSDAPDLAPGTAPGVTNVFTVARAEPFGDNGTPWAPGATALASTGLGGLPANGNSYGAALGGTSKTAPTCVAFISAASNLVPGDTNGVPDAFIRNLRTGHITRVSVSSSGAQANGPTTEVAVDGLCDAVAFTSSATNLALTHTRHISWRTAVTRAPEPGISQVYVRFLGGHRGIDRAVRGLTFDVSANGHRTPGDGSSSQPAWAADGRALAFSSMATNLGGRDDNGASDVFERTFTRRYAPKRHGHSPQYYRLGLRVVSEDSQGRRGDGSSTSPDVNNNGTDIAYQTTAGNLVGRQFGAPQVVRADMTHHRPQTDLMSRTHAGGPGNGPSGPPTITDGGTWVIFGSSASDLGSRNGNPAAPTGYLWSQNGPEIFAFGPTSGYAGAPRSSAHGNYVVFSRGGQVWLLYVGPE